MQSGQLGLSFVSLSPNVPKISPTPNPLPPTICELSTELTGVKPSDFTPLIFQSSLLLYYRPGRFWWVILLNPHCPDFLKHLIYSIKELIL